MLLHENQLPPCFGSLRPVKQTELPEFSNFTLTNLTEELNNLSFEMKLSNNVLQHPKATYQHSAQRKPFPEKSAQTFTKSVLELES